MPESTLDHATDDERRELALLRAEQWRGALTTINFRDRNDRLYSHPFGKARVETWLLRGPRGEILTSMDVLAVGLVVKREDGAPKQIPGILIASVITAPELRGKGYSSALLSGYFDSRSEVSGVLYSDIGPPFYARFGFTETPVRCVEIAASAAAGRGSLPAAISLETFAAKLSRLRVERVALSATLNAVALYPDPQWLDWQVERYRFFAEMKGRGLGDLFFEAEHAGGRHLLGAVPDFISGRLDAFWVEAQCPACLMTLQQLAAIERLPLIRFWTKADSSWPGTVECPMVRVAGASADPAFVDPQFCDWW